MQIIAVIMKKLKENYIYRYIEMLEENQWVGTRKFDSKTI